MSFRLIFPRSVSPMNSPIVSSSRKMRTKGSDILHALIFGLGMVPSTSLMTCRSVPSVRETRVNIKKTKLNAITHQVPEP